jgi:hypothetical protein
MSTTLESDRPPSPLSVENEIKSLLQKIGAHDLDSDAPVDDLNGSITSSHDAVAAIAADRKVEFVDRNRFTQDNLSITDPDAVDHTDILTSHMMSIVADCQSHLMHVKQRLLADKDQTLRARDAFYTEHLNRQQQVIEKLNEDLSRTEIERENGKKRLAVFCDKVLHMYGRKLISHISEYSIVRIFNSWRTYTSDRARLNQMVGMANKFLRRSILHRAFSSLTKEFYIRKLAKVEADSKFRFEGTARQMVLRYEAEIARLQGECAEAQTALLHEQYRRQQLEEDLRRMFLKNMTIMNMEALSLFQQPSAPVPQMAGAAPSSSSLEQAAQENMSVQMTQQAYLRGQMKQQQQTLQQNRTGVNAASTMSRAGSGAPEEEEEDALPRATMPPQPVRSALAPVVVRK